MNKWVLRALVISLMTALVLPLGVIVGHAAIYRNKIYPGVQVAEIAVGGLTKDQAESRIKKMIIPPEKFLLTYKSEEWTMNFADLEAKLRADRSAENAFAVGRQHGLFQNLADRYSVRSGSVSFPITWSLKTEKARPFVLDAAKAIDQPAVDARLLINYATVKIEPHQNSRETQIDKTMTRIKAALLKNRDKAVVAVKEESPKTTTRELKKLGIETLVAEFTTSLSATRNNRRHNIALATGMINDTYIEPGATFSFNETVGTRTSANGFLDAPVISGGNLVPGIGGGICQVATTLYNASMSSGLPTVERSIHSNFISSYPAGRDATVVDGVLDFKFRNDLSGHLLIKSVVADKAVVFRIYGPKTERKTVFGDPVVTNYAPFATKVETDTALPSGVRVKKQAGVTGRTVTVTRKVTDGDKVLIDEVNSSRYLPRQELIRVGPAPPPPPETETETATPSSEDQ